MKRKVGFFLIPAGVALGAALILSCGLGFSAQQPQRVWINHPALEVTVPDFPAEGLILDIGGGGEGVMGQLKGKQIIAVDLLKQELVDAPAGPLLKIVMDARDLKFLDKTFPTVTVFFTFMYINPTDHAKVFQEIHRVLLPGGRLLIWDVIFPPKTDPKQDSVSYPLRIQLPQKNIRTGYGVRHVEGQGAEHFVAAAKAAGFELVSRKDEKGWFYLELKKIG